jgi:hypothetical protein
MRKVDQMWVRPGVVSYNILLLGLLLHESRIGRSMGADHEEGGVHIIFLENGEYLKGIRGIRAVVKGQRDFWKIRIATV